MFQRMKRSGLTNLVLEKVLWYFPMVNRIPGGVLIAFRKSVNYKITEQYVDSNGRYIVLNVLLDSVPFILVNYYAPNYETDQLKLLEELSHIFDQLDTTENTTLIWGGDFTMIFDTYPRCRWRYPKIVCKISFKAPLVNV